MNKIAAIQMVSGDDVDANLHAADVLIKKAVDKGASLIVLPENFALFSASHYANFLCGPDINVEYICNFIAQKAQEHKLWILAGTIPLPKDWENAGRKKSADSNHKKRQAASLLFNDAGECVGRYNKLHLFDVEVDDQQGHYKESDYFESGESSLVADTSVGRLGLTVCYDLRFPELFATLVKKSAEVIAVPSAFTKFTGQAHWETLLRARAIETQSYIVAANQGGKHSSGRETYGHSMIVSPWGDIISQCDQGEGVICAEIDLEKLYSIRKKMPLNNHRRFKITSL